jgi:hypothetical protein
VKSSSWPKPLSEEAFYGLAGEVVRTIEPHSEGDPAALLLQLLVAFGNVIGKGPHFQVEADRHALNLFSVLVGETSKSRKGSSLGHVRKLMSRVDSDWGQICIQTGLSSGEGLIYSVRDSTEDDNGALDARRLIIETEFVSPLRMTTRDGNTLSPVVRQAWDGTTLQIMSRQSPYTASSAHVSIIGHITREELKRELIRADGASGFGNRFLWGCVRRSRILPDGGHPPESAFERLTWQLKQAVGYASSLGHSELRRSEEARIIWHSIYADLSEGKPGLFGAVTSRGEAQVMRMACLYALLDESSEVRPEHLKAAMAVWKYCEDSARFIFGRALGDPLADALLRSLKATPDGLTRTELNVSLGRNRTAVEISQALAVLAENGLATAEMVETDGRPAQRWFAQNPNRQPDESLEPYSRPVIS